MIIALCVIILCLLVALSILLIVMFSRSTHTESLFEPSLYQTAYVAQPGARRAGVLKQWRMLLKNMRTEQQYQIILDHPVVMGRSMPDYPDYNDIGVGSSVTISKRQCQIFEMAGQVYLQNLSQVNCTRLNERLLDKPTSLHQGDVIQVAETALQVTMLWSIQV